MNKVITHCVAAMLVLVPIKVFASENDLLQAINELRVEIQELRGKVESLQRVIERDHGSRYVQPVHWGCNAERFGHYYYGTGYSREEAAGKALSACSEKEGWCPSAELKCSSSLDAD